MTVKFDSNGGSAVADAKVDYNTAVAKPTDPTLDGSTFQGWELDGKAYDFNAKVTKDITLKATWKANAAEEPEDPENPTTPTIPTTVEVTKNEDGSFSFADGTYTFVIDGPNPVLKFSMPEEVSCTIGDKLKLTGKINFGDTAVYKQFYIQTNATAGVPLFGYNMLAEWNNGLSGDQPLSLSQTIPDKIGEVTYCTSFKDCKFVLSAPITADDKTLINVTFSNVKMTYEKVDPNAVIKEDISLAASFWGWGYKSKASNADDGSLIITNTEATGAGSFGYKPTKDWSGYKTLEIVLGDQTEWKGAAWAQVTIQNEKDAEGKQPSVNGSIDVSKTTQTIVIDLETASATIDLTKISQIAVQSGAADSVIQVTACYLTK